MFPYPQKLVSRKAFIPQTPIPFFMFTDKKLTGILNLRIKSLTGAHWYD